MCHIYNKVYRLAVVMQFPPQGEGVEMAQKSISISGRMR
jgi:hypothetical protein